MSVDEEEDDGIGGLLVVNMQIEFYLKQRDDPLHVYMSVGVPRQVFEDHGVLTGIWALMDEATDNIVGEMDSKGSPYIFVTDKRMNRTVIMSDEIQSVSILTPDQETVEAAMQEEDDE